MNDTEFGQQDVQDVQDVQEARRDRVFPVNSTRHTA